MTTTMLKRGSQESEILLGNLGARINLRGYDGVEKNPIGGAVTSSGNYGLIEQTTHGKNIAVPLISTAVTAALTPANSVLLVDEAGAFIGSGKAIRLYDAAGVDYAQLSGDADGGLVLGGSGANAGLLTIGDLLATGNLKWKSGTSFTATLDHAMTADRTVVFQDLAGSVALLGAQNAGHLIFNETGNYNIGAAGATRPHDLFLARNATLGGILSVGGASATLAVLTALHSSADTSESGAGVRLYAAATDTQLMLGTIPSVGSYIQSMQQATSWTTRPLTLQPNGGGVVVGDTLAAGGHITTPASTDKTVTAANAQIGRYNANDATACFRHSATSGAGDYGLVHTSGGRTLMNSATGLTNSFRVNNVEIATLGATSGVFAGQIAFTNGTAPITTATIGPQTTLQHTLPSVASDTFALLAATQTFTGKTLTSPTINGAALSGTLSGNHTLSGTVTFSGLLDVTNGQIGFPATQNASAGANTLDDYQEGPWTPSLGGSATYTGRDGWYVKIGHTVLFGGFITVNAIGTGSTTVISGLPESGTDFNDDPACATKFASLATSVVSLTFRITGTTLVSDGLTAAGASSTTPAIFGNGASVHFTGHYRTAN